MLNYSITGFRIFEPADYLSTKYFAINLKTLNRMKTKRHIILFSLLILQPLAHAKSFIYPDDVPVDQQGIRIMQSVTIDSNLHIDGRFDEPVWSKVKFQGNFIQREPNLGEPASERTEVAVLQNKHNLYLGIKCYDSEPDRIIARDMRRDAELDNEDYFQIVIDSYHDLRNGYYFKTNPYGAKKDATIGDEGKSYNPDWDGIWDCAARITEEGWFVEIEIPWKTLNFVSSDSATWGINFARGIMRKNEHSFWQLVSRDAGRMGLFRFSQAGRLTGLAARKSGGNLEFQPYLLAGLERDSNTDFKIENVSNFGVDAKVGLSSNLYVNLTWNTDFAQVESDQEQVNLTRFSLYFPEKREFFLEGAETFNFGGAESGRSRGGDGNGIRLFYSRRIGIAGRTQQPIIGGARMIGKVGNYQVGLLNMQTEEATHYDEDDDETTIYPSTNFTAVRVRRDVFRRSNIGFMLLNKEESGTGHYNRSGGVDMNFPITDQFTISGGMASTTGPNKEDDGETINMQEKNKAGFFAIGYESDLWELGLKYLDIEENFNAEMGFVRRTDIRSTSTELEFSPRPQRWESIRQVGFRMRHEYLTDHQNVMLESTLNTSFFIRYQNSARLYTGIERSSEFLDKNWEVRPDYLIPKATYDTWRGYIWLITNESANIANRTMASYGGYYTGKSLRLNSDFTVYNIERLRMDLELNYNHVNLPVGKFDTRTLGLRFYYYFSTDLYLKTYLQWNDDRKANDGNQITVANVLLHWIYKPGSDFYLVFNEGRLIGETGQEITNRTLMFKATFFWRK